MKLFTRTIWALAILAGMGAGELMAAESQLVTNWFTTNSAKYARVYKTTTAEGNGTTSTTWTDQDLPVYSDIQVVSQSSTWVYVQYSGLASHVMGPWLNPQGGQFQFWPVNQSGIHRFPKTPVVQSGTKDSTSGGYSGLFVNGVAIFNSLDGQAWDGSQIQGQAPHTQSTYYWHRNAPVAEAFNFDAALGHQPPSGIYHTHQNPLGLRYQLGDHVDYSTITKDYTESAAAVTKHSPIIGWAHDGYPIYGPYGYGTALSSASAVRRMVPGYVKRDGNNSTDIVDNNRSVIPAWYARYRVAHFGGAYSTTAGASRPAVNTTYPLGTFAQDWSYLGDLGKTQGTDFDLDEYNGRFCVTPEYPSGTYAYFTAIDSTGAANYPYLLAFEFYGDAKGGSVASISESVTDYYVGGEYSDLTLPTPSVNSVDDTVTVVWSSIEGGTYKVESSNDAATWNTETASITASGTTTQSTFTGNGSSGYTRVTRTGLASFDSAITGTYSTTQTASQSYSTPVSVIYVNAARAGQAVQDGASWATAYAYLTDALYNSADGDEIWVAAGVYYPDEAVSEGLEIADNDRSSTFELYINVAIYGGFNGTETSRNQRDPSANLTVLSGDLDKNDTTVNGVVVTSPETNTTGNNAYHVVTLYEGDETAILDGFTITAGRADGTGTQSYGGGIYAKFSTPAFSQCVVQGNYALSTGAGIYAGTSYDDAVLTKVDVLANTSSESVAGIYFDSGHLYLNSCRVQGNISLPNNYFGFSDAIYVIEGSLTMSNCLVSGNYGKLNSTIQVDSEGSSLTAYVYNSTITGNYSDTNPAVSTGGFGVTGSVDFRVYNSIIWGNVSVGGDANVRGLDAQYYSLIEGKNPGNNGNLNGTDANNVPLFLSGITASATATTSGDFRLYGNSPGIDVGDNTSASDLTSDLTGNSRVVNATVDLGAYEYNGPTVSTPIGSQTVNPSGGQKQVADLDNIFTGTGLSFGVSATGNSGIFDATLGSGNVLNITPTGVTGSGTVYVTATDGSGNQYTLSFTVTLEAAPEPANGLTQNIAAWLKAYSGRYARIYRTYADEQAGAAQTTWDNGTYAQSLPVYGGVQKIQHSDNYVYVTTTGLAAGHVMGPWYNDTGIGGSLEVFQNWPQAIYTIYRLPAQPVIPETKTTYPGGAIGLMVDGTIIFSESDSFSWDNAGNGTGNGSDTGPTVIGGGLGDGLWLHDAYVTESNTFDKSNAHAAGNQLHYHASPMKLRHLLGDSVQATQQPDGSYTYSENFNGKHSPLLGWINDGIPLYGPYGYSDAMDAGSGVRRMVSGFIVRDGANGSYNTAVNGRTTLPAWSARYRGRSTACNINEQGPTAATVAVPYFMEDYDYLGDLTNPADSQPYEQGVDFDLNEYNVRFCVTPEFPEGTWAYFVSIGADGKPAFPYNVSAQYFGDPNNGGAATSISESVITDWVGGPDAEVKMSITDNGDDTVTLAWNAAEGGTYTLESATDIAAGTWPNSITGITPVQDLGQYVDASSSGQKFYRTYRTALAAYDTTGTTAGMGGGTGGGTGGGGTGGAPSISQISPNTGTEGASVTVSITLAGDMLPPSDAIPTVTIGSFNGTSVSYNGTTVTASFTLTAGTTGAQNVTVTFPAPPGMDALVVTSTGGFTINAIGGGGGGGGGVVTFNATFATNPPLPPQNAIEVAAVGTATATITSYNQGTGAVTLQFNNSALATGNHSATLKFTPPGMSQQTLTSANQYTRN